MCDSYGLICTHPMVWILHYLNTCGASCESKILGVFASKIEGIAAIEKQLGCRIKSKSIFKRYVVDLCDLFALFPACFVYFA